MHRPALRSAVPPLAFEQVLDSLNDPVIASDDSGAILYVNAAAERLLGWSGAELVGRPLTVVMPERLRPAHERGFRRFMATGQSTIIGRPVRVAALHRDGIEIDVELTLSELRPETGQLLVVAVIRDLRERVELEMKVAAQRKLLAQYATVSVLAEASDARSAMPKLLEAAATALDREVGIYWAQDPATNRLAMSAAWSSGSSAADAFLAGSRSMTFGRGEGLPGAVFASGRAEWSRDVRSDPRYLRSGLAREHGLRSALVFPVSTPDRIWGVLEYLSDSEEALDEELRQTVTVLGFQIGQFLARLEHEGSVRRALAHAEAERRNLETLFEGAPAAIAIVRGPDMRYELSNAVNQELAGGRQLVGRTVREALPELEGDGVTAAIKRVYETGEPFVAREYPMMAPATANRPARRIFMNGVSQPLRGAGGDIEGVMIFASEVTDLVMARRRVEEAEERLRLALESAEIGTWDYDPQAGTIQCDARFRRLFGLGLDGDLTTNQLMEAIHPEDRPRVEETSRRTFDPRNDGSYVVEYRTIGVNDRVERWVSVRGRTFFDEGGKPRRFVGTAVDITREKIALERERFLAEAGTILSSSLEYPMTLAALAKLAVPRLADWCAVDLVPEEGGSSPPVVEHVDSAKVELARELRRRYPEDPNAPTGMHQVLRTGQSMLISDVTKEMIVRAARDTEHLRILSELGLRSAMLVPLKVRDRTVGVLALFQAESGRRYTEDDLAFAEEVARRAGAAVDNAQLYEQAKRAIGIRDEFLSIASHELRTPLTSLMLQLSSFSRLAAAGAFKGLPTADKLEGRIARMHQQAARLTALVDELLNVSRIATGRLALDRKPTDLVDVVKEVLDRLGEEAERAGCGVTLHAPESLIGTWDRNRLDQVVTNLVANAIKYAPGQRIDVHLEPHGGMVRILVSDQGPGISEVDQKRIFEQFERAAASALAGFGLGLWIVRSIVEAHGGRVEVASELGKGATFQVDLPESPQ